MMIYGDSLCTIAGIPVDQDWPSAAQFKTVLNGIQLCGRGPILYAIV
jgi:hypothetical protein